jgi:hypothetical protein
MSTTAIGGTPDEVPGLYLFTPEELAIYLKLMAASRDMSITAKKRKQHRGNAAVKLNNVIEKRMPIAEKLVLEAKKQAETQRKHQERLQFVEYALSLFTSKQREDYDALLAGSTDPKNSAAKRTACAKVVARKLSLITTKQADKDRKYQERLQFVEYALSLFASKQREEYDALLTGSTDPKNSAAKRATCVKSAARKLWLITEKQADIDKRSAMSPEEVELYDNDEERVAAKADKARIQKEGAAKRAEKQAVLRLAGDAGALAQRAATNEISRKRYAAICQRKKEEEAKNAKIFPKSARKSTVFGEGDARQESITRKVEEIMGSHAGSALDPSGKPTSEKWVRDHGDVSVGDKLAEGEFAAYLGITRTTVDPGNEQECKETKVFITAVGRDPLWRIEQEDGDLKRMSPLQAKSVVNVYLLAKYENPYDVTSLEGMCQFYLENELGLPHGICLHKRAGAGNRLKDSMTPEEYKLFRSGKLKGWSLTLTMIRTTDCVFAAVDPDDPERSPPLVSASVPTHDGTGTVYRIRVRGNKQSFPDTPSVVADRKKNKAKYQKDKARRQKRKRDATKPSDTAEAPEEMEEETVKKRKIEVVDGVE